MIVFPHAKECGLSGALEWVLETLDSYLNELGTRWWVFDGDLAVVAFPASASRITNKHEKNQYALSFMRIQRKELT
jgi:hypothetical protein